MRHLALVAFLILSHALLAQDFSDRFLGEDVVAYKGATLKFKEDVTSGLFYSFYGDLKHCQDKHDGNVLYPTSPNGFVTAPDSLKGRLFKVTDIVNKRGQSISTPLALEPPIIVLEDVNNKKIIYFIYDVKYKHKFPFLVANLIIDKDFMCKKIYKNTDDFDGTVRIGSPIMANGKVLPVQLSKNISEGKVTYYLSLRTTGETVSVDGNTAIVLFTDGTKWTKTVAIDVEAGKNGFDYKAFIELSETDLTVFRTKQVNKFRLHIYDETLDTVTAENFMIYLECIEGMH
jgi:hypothetical protein